MRISSCGVHMSESIDVRAVNSMSVPVGMKTGVFVEEPTPSKVAEQLLFRGLRHSIGHLSSGNPSAFGK